MSGQHHYDTVLPSDVHGPQILEDGNANDQEFRDLTEDEESDWRLNYPIAAMRQDADERLGRRDRGSSLRLSAQKKRERAKELDAARLHVRISHYGEVEQRLDDIERVTGRGGAISSIHTADSKRSKRIKRIKRSKRIKRIKRSKRIKRIKRINRSKRNKRNKSSKRNKRNKSSKRNKRNKSSKRNKRR